MLMGYLIICYHGLLIIFLPVFNEQFLKAPIGAPITSGAPQGSLLAPLMFVIFIYDLPDASNGEVKILRFTLTIQRSLVLSSAFTTVKLCKPPFQIWMNGLDITSNLTPLNVKS